MRSMMGMGLLGVVLSAVPALAEDRHGPRDGRGKGDGVVEYLALSDEQQGEWRALHAQHREDLKPLMEEGRVLRQRVQESLEADEPEILVGEAVKALHAHGKQVEAAREAFQVQLAAVLTAEQQERFEAFRAARKASRRDFSQRRQRGPRGSSPSLET